MSDAVLVPLQELQGRTQWSFEHAGRCYAVFVVGDELHATDGGCPHKGGPLPGVRLTRSRRVRRLRLGGGRPAVADS